ncbi:MAG: CidA/LrgA family protein [Candidatus Gastranaerophilales bacterium]|nr:CidA/LrgA family protein [Candidatus Gastranaerophilales bacterium]
MLTKIFKIIIGFLIIISIQAVSHCIIQLLKLPLSEAILGLIIFTGLLKLEIINKNYVEDCVNLILNYMPLLFIPLFVGIISYYNIIENELLKLALIIILSTIFVLILTALTVEAIIKYVRLSKFKNKCEVKK